MGQTGRGVLLVLLIYCTVPCSYASQGCTCCIQQSTTSNNAIYHTCTRLCDITQICIRNVQYDLETSYTKSIINVQCFFWQRLSTLMSCLILTNCCWKIPLLLLLIVIQPQQLITVIQLISHFRNGVSQGSALINSRRHKRLAEPSLKFHVLLTNSISHELTLIVCPQ